MNNNLQYRMDEEKGTLINNVYDRCSMDISQFK